MTSNERRRHGRGRSANKDFRIICECQLHSSWKRRLRGALRIASRGAALLVGIPLTFAALDLPTAAMNIDIDAIRATRSVATRAVATQTPIPRAAAARTVNASAASSTTLPIFTTPSARESFMRNAESREPLTLEIFRESYFKRHVPYGGIIYREAQKNGLSPELVAAMVHTESDFRPTLVSHKSAQGLMQIVPSTARLLGIKNPFDPEQNIAAGTRYFRYLLDRFDNETMALAAYNAGEGNVSRFRGVPPFRETRDYIVKVNRRTHRYRQRVHSTYVSALRLSSAVAQ